MIGLPSEMGWSGLEKVGRMDNTPPVEVKSVLSHFRTLKSIEDKYNIHYVQLYLA